MEMTNSVNVAVKNSGNVALNVFTAGADWEAFIKQLQQFFEENAIGEDRQVAILLTCIGENVHSTLRNLCHPVRPITKSLAELVTLLDAEFKPKVSTYRKRIEFDRLRQNEEGVNEWYLKVTEVASKCEFGEYLDFRVKDKFVTGMKPGPVLDRLCEEQISVILSELLEIALLKEEAFGNTGATMDIDEVIKSENTDDSYEQEIPYQSTSYPHIATEEMEIKLQDLHHSIDIKEDFSVPDQQSEEINRKKFLCTICDYKSPLKATLNIHLQTHVKEKPFACEICNYKFGSETNLNIHVRTTHTGEKPFTCKFCKCKFLVKSSLTKHLRAQWGTCGYKCTHKPSVERHLRTSHPEKLFTCEVCGFKSSRRKNLIIHLKTHTGQKPYLCEICGCKFTGKRNLVNHIRVHAGEKPFMCAVCNYKCALKENLVTHLKNHEKPFACDFCGYRCALKTNFQVHLKVHISGKPLTCSFCDYKCLQEMSLENHLRSHTGDDSVIH